MVQLSRQARHRLGATSLTRPHTGQCSLPWVPSSPRGLLVITHSCLLPSRPSFSAARSPPSPTGREGSYLSSEKFVFPLFRASPSMFFKFRVFPRTLSTQSGGNCIRPVDSGSLGRSSSTHRIIPQILSSTRHVYFINIRF